MKHVPPGAWGHNNDLHPPQRIDRVQRQRRGYDISWLIIVGIILSVIIAGVLHNKGLLNFIP